jgi:triacylglycerol lipase
MKLRAVLPGVVLAAALGTLLGCRSLARGMEPSETVRTFDFAELLHYLQVYDSLRRQPTEVLYDTWGRYYRELQVVELTRTENRYLIGTRFGGEYQEVLIRGTANTRNAFYDAKFRKHWNARLGVYLHKGFEQMALAVYYDILPRLAADSRLVIYGHSLGAAEAMILAMLLDQDGYRIEAVIGTGCPKVTDRRGAARFERLNVLRVTCADDPIPRLPPRGLAPALRAYAHVGQELLLLDGPYYVYGAPPIAEPGAAVPSLARVSRERMADRLYEHKIEHYIGQTRPKLTAAIQVPFADRWDYVRRDRRRAGAPDAPHP